MEELLMRARLRLENNKLFGSVISIFVIVLKVGSSWTLSIHVLRQPQ